MKQSSVRALWSTPNRTRYFLLPGDRELPPGDLVLVILTGKRQEVDPATVAEFEISREEAKTWAQTELKGVLVDVRGKIQGALDEVRRKWEEKAAAPEDQETRRAAAETLESLAAGLERTGSAAGEKLRAAAAQNLRREAELQRDEEAGTEGGGTDGDRI